ALKNVFRRQRSDLGRFVEWIADLQCAHTFDKLPKKFIVNFVRDEKPLRRNAGLAIINCARFDCSSQCCFEIAARHDDERIASTQLEHTFLDVACGGAGDRASGFFTSGERDCLHPWIDNYLFYLLRFDQECLKNALVEAGSAKNLFNRERTLGNVGGVFQESHVSRQQGGRRKSKHLPERKIPGHDSKDRKSTRLNS